MVAFALLLERKPHNRKARRFEAPREIVLVKISPARGRGHSPYKLNSTIHELTLLRFQAASGSGTT